MTPPGVAAVNLCLDYEGRRIFENLSFTLEAGKFSILLGQSGVGKTSLLRMIAGLHPITSGHIAATDGFPLAGRIAYMAQQDLLLPWANSLNNVMLGPKLRGERRNPDMAASLLARVGLQHRTRALPADLSGGERQRVALARTLYENRPVILMDEPFSALDAITRTRIQDLATELLSGRTVLLITHDPLEACRIGHSLSVLSGSPARLEAPMYLSGLPPRQPDSPDVTHTQGELLRRLAHMP